MTLETIQLPNGIGGNLALDFVNTTEFRGTDHCLEALHSYAHVLVFCLREDLFSVQEGAMLEVVALRRRTEAETAFQTALDLREALYRIFLSVIEGGQPLAPDLDRLNESLVAGQRQIVLDDQGFAWVWAQRPNLSRILAPIALAAAELLTSERLSQVRQCPNCGWLFVDTSRNHSRRWCSMDFCGSQVKSRRQYERRKNSLSIS
jgi:predicted RNA-binding Zn ribbon-like protein